LSARTSGVCVPRPGACCRPLANSFCARRNSYGGAGLWRSDQNIGFRRSKAGVSGGFAATGACTGIESSFPAWRWSGRLAMRAATLARISSGLGPVIARHCRSETCDRGSAKVQCSSVIHQDPCCKREVSQTNKICPCSLRKGSSSSL